MFLLSGIGNNGLWLSYAFKIDNMDIAFIAFAGKLPLLFLKNVGAIVPFFLAFIYLAVKPSLKDAALFIAFLTLCSVAFLPVVPH